MTEAQITLLGITIQTALYLLGALALFLRNESKQKTNTEHLSNEVKDMRDELKKLAEVITTQAVQTARIDSIADQFTLLHRTVEDLRRGNGFVKGRAGLDGEY